MPLCRYCLSEAETTKDTQTRERMEKSEICSRCGFERILEGHSETRGPKRFSRFIYKLLS